MRGEAEAGAAREVSREGCKQERRTNLRVSREEALQAMSGNERQQWPRRRWQGAKMTSDRKSGQWDPMPRRHEIG